MVSQISQLVTGVASGNRVPNTPRIPKSDHPSVLSAIDRAVGDRYRDCRLDNFECVHEGQSEAVEQCRKYVFQFRDHFAVGRGLVFVGPKGTGKDHLMIAVLKAIVSGWKVRMPNRPQSDHYLSHYVSAFDVFSRYRDATRKWSGECPARVVNAYVGWDLLAISDPVPVGDQLTEWDREILKAIVDGRYKRRRPIMATLNIATRDDLEHRIGPATSDRMLDEAIVVKCNWPSYRQRSKSINRFESVEPSSATIAGVFG